MDVIALARQLGAELQKDERYLAYLEAQKANEEDKELNELIAKIQFLQASFQQEMSKPDRDDAKIQQMDQEFGQLYAQITANPHMKAYEAATADLDRLMKYINGIFTLCLQGEDPETCEPAEESGCTGDCSGCAGCN